MIPWILFFELLTSNFELKKNKTRIKNESHTNFLPKSNLDQKLTCLRMLKIFKFRFKIL